MKELTHLLLATALLLLTFLIQLLNQQDAFVKRADVVKFHTLERHRGDPLAAAGLISNPLTWIGEPCAAVTNLTLDPTCKAARTALQTKVLAALECDAYRSPMCAYASRILASLVNGTVGKNLTGLKDTLANAIQYSASVFHNSFKAKESDSNWVLRSTLFGLIAAAVASNTFAHVFEYWMWKREWKGVSYHGARWFLIVLPLFLVVGTSFNYAQAANLMLLTILPAAALLVWYEMLLPTVTRPWVHPFAFALIFSSVTMLALVENGVTSYRAIVTEGLKAQVVNFLYMGIVWFFFSQYQVDGPAKVQNFGDAVTLSHEGYFHALLSVFIMVTSVALTFSAPYAYSFWSPVLLAGPAIFLTIALGSTLWILFLHPHTASAKAEVFALTPQKLTSSVFLLGFGAAYTLVLFFEHVTTYRASQDIWPTVSINYDPSLAWVVGSGAALPSA